MYCFKISNCDRSKMFGFQNCMSISHCDIFQCKIIIQYTLTFHVSYCCLEFLLFPSQLWRYNIIYDFKRRELTATKFPLNYLNFLHLFKLLQQWVIMISTPMVAVLLSRHQWMQLTQIYSWPIDIFCARNKSKLKALKINKK